MQAQMPFEGPSERRRVLRRVRRLDLLENLRTRACPVHPELNRGALSRLVCLLKMVKANGTCLLLLPSDPQGLQGGDGAKYGANR